MDFSHYTELAQKAVASSQELARERSHSTITPLHLLKTIVQETSGLPYAVLKSLQIDPTHLETSIHSALQKLPTVSGGQIGAEPKLVDIFKEAEKQMRTMKDSFVSLEHLLLALSIIESDAKTILSGAGVSTKTLQSTISSVRGPHSVQDQNPEAKLQALEKYTIDFTKLAEEGKLDPVIGRDSGDRHPRRAEVWVAARLRG
jgi:ATP-dependent Clp protease ATP-binding subunit ClpB